MNRILSFDVGIKNLSYCIADVPKRETDTGSIVIQKWENVCITEKKCNNIKLYESARNMIDTLKDIFPIDVLNEIDVVLIENQPAKVNRTMKSLSMIMYTFFLMYDKYVKFISPSNKLKCSRCQDVLKIKNYDLKKYYDRKKLSIDTVTILVEENFKEFQKQFKKEKKKDDMSDSLLYIIHYFENMR